MFCLYHPPIHPASPPRFQDWVDSVRSPFAPVLVPIFGQHKERSRRFLLRIRYNGQKDDTRTIARKLHQQVKWQVLLYCTSCQNAPCVIRTILDSECHGGISENFCQSQIDWWRSHCNCKMMFCFVSRCVLHDVFLKSDSTLLSKNLWIASVDIFVCFDPSRFVSSQNRCALLNYVAHCSAYSDDR